MITRIYAHSAAERRHGWPNQAIDCSRVLAVQQYRFLRKIHGLSAENARDRLHQIMFIGVTGRYVPSTTAVHRPVEAVIGARRIEDNASTGATGEVGGWQFDGPEILDEVDEFFDRLASSPFVLNDHVSPDAIEARLPPRPQTEVAGHVGFHCGTVVDSSGIERRYATRPDVEDGWVLLSIDGRCMQSVPDDEAKVRATALYLAG